MSQPEAIAPNPLPRFSRTLIAGALAGALAAIAVLVLVTPILLDRLNANPLETDSGRVQPVFELSGLTVDLPHLLTIDDTEFFNSSWDLSPLFMFTFLAAVGFGIAGALTVALTRWVPRTFDAAVTAPKRSTLLYANGIGVGVVVGVLAAQFAATWVGESSGANLQIGIFRFLAILVLAGATLGAGVAVSTHLLERPDLVGTVGNTWQTRSQFFKAVTRATSIPMMAMIGIAAVVIPLGIVLLALTDEVGDEATLIFAVLVAASILGLASVAAYKK